MLYNPPTGGAANDPYVGKNTAGGTQGSKVPPAAVEYPQRELVALIAASGQAPTNTVLVQAAQALGRGIWVGDLTGSGDLAVATLSVVLPTLLRGMRIRAAATAANTTTTPKLRVVNLASAGSYVDFPILKEDGSVPAVGEIKAGRRYWYEADGSGNVTISGGGISGDAFAAAKASGTGFNTTVLPSTQRNSASAAAAGSVVPVVTLPNFSKKSSTSILRIRSNFFVHSPVVPGQGNGAVTVRATITVLATGQTFIDDRIVNCTFLLSGGSSTGSGSNTPTFRFTGVPAGTLSLTIGLKRDDAAPWTSIYGATGADSSGLPTPNPSLYEADELEVLS